VRIPITSQLALLVLSLASWKAWNGPATPDAPHTFVVQHADLGDHAEIDVCGHAVELSQATHVASKRLPRWGCEITVTRTDGDYEIVRTAFARGTGPTEIALPDHRVGGIGVVLGRSSSGPVPVEEVFPGGAAREAGVQPGARLIEVDGRRVDGAAHARELLLGREGSLAEVTIASGGHRDTLWLERRSDVRSARQPTGRTVLTWFSVENAYGDTWVEACGHRVRAIDVGDGRSVGLASVKFHPEAGCVARAVRIDGDYEAVSEQVPLDEHDGGETIALSLPERRIGGIGVQLDERDGHVYVARVLPKGAAAEWGVREGERVLAVDGVPIRDWEDAHRRIVGSEGSAVRIDFARLHWRGDAWEEFHFELERRSDVE
jgi:membrane-associated protease RseP (regulator of RpoE activity)